MFHWLITWETNIKTLKQHFLAHTFRLGSAEEFCWSYQGSFMWLKLPDLTDMYAGGSGYLFVLAITWDDREYIPSKLAWTNSYVNSIIQRGNKILSIVSQFSHNPLVKSFLHSLKKCLQLLISLNRTPCSSSQVMTLLLT